jgi:hypothetical protein
MTREFRKKENDMTTKQEGGDPCYEKAEPDEPIFVLRAQDILAPEIVREWAYRASKLGSPREKVVGARAIADQMEDWQIERERRKVPD